MNKFNLFNQEKILKNYSIEELNFLFDKMLNDNLNQYKSDTDVENYIKLKIKEYNGTLHEHMQTTPM